MLGEYDAVDFVLAETMGKTLSEVRALPNAEITEWRAFLKYRNAMEELAAKRSR